MPAYTASSPASVCPARCPSVQPRLSPEAPAFLILHMSDAPKPAGLEKENRSPSMKPSAQEKKQRGRGCRRTSCLKGRAFPWRFGDVGRNMVWEQRRVSSDRGEPRRHLSVLGTRGGHGDRGPGSQQHHEDLVDFQSPSPPRCCPPPDALAPLQSSGWVLQPLVSARHSTEQDAEGFSSVHFALRRCQGSSKLDPTTG